MSNFIDISTQIDSLIKRDEIQTEIRISVSKKHRILASITRVGLFKTGGIFVDLISLSKSGALFSSTHHSLVKSSPKDMTIEISLDGKHFKHDAYIIRQDAINNLYGVKFHQPVHAIDDYLADFHIPLHYGLNPSLTSAGNMWLNLNAAINFI